MAQAPPVTGGRLTEPCPECGERIEVPGKMSAALRLGMHRKKDHGYVSQHRAGKKPPQAQREPERVTPLTVLGDAGKDAGAGKKQSPPSAADLTKGLARVVGYCDVMVTSVMVDGDPAITERPAEEQDDIHDELVSMIAMQPDEAKAIMGPFARMAAGTRINKRLGRKFVDNLDAFDAIAALTEIARRKRRYLRARRDREGGVAPAPPGAGPAGPAPAAAPPRGSAPWPTSPAGTRGVVVTPDMVAAMQGRRNGAPQPIPGAGQEGA